MSQLAQKTCKACNKDSQPISEEEQDEYMLSLTDWEIIPADGVAQLTKVFSFKNFVQAMTFTQAVGDIAEAENHHPALLTEWGKVTVTWWTHSMGGLYHNDFILAARTDHLFQ